MFRHAASPKKLLVLGGVHGNEPEGIMAANMLLTHLQVKTYQFEINVIPCFNPDGAFRNSRLNGANVDLNRNLPTQDWSVDAFSPKYPPGPTANSEPENQALVQWLEQEAPFFVISLHSFEKYMMNINGACKELAEAMRKVNQYPIEESIGYPTPGCLGTYCGLEREMPTITYEIERGLSPEKIRDVHLPALIAGLEYIDSNQ